MTAGPWRARYVPGDWLVLCGPTSVVVLEPPGDGWTPLVAELWEHVLAASSLVDLADRLAGYGLDTMPSFAALFWAGGEMRSLVRGDVSVLDDADDRVLAHGRGIRTWSESGLGALRRVRLSTPGTPSPGDLQLPLVVGAVKASSVLLDATAAEPTDALPPGVEPTERLGRPSAPAVAATEVLAPAPVTAPTELLGVVGGTLAGASVLAGPALGPVVAVLRASNGVEVGLDGPVLVGRAPAARPGRPARLLTVFSPAHDISRTHLLLEPRGREVAVTDLHSTNGTLLVEPGGVRRSLPPGDAVRIPLGSRLELADGVSIMLDAP